MRLIDTEKLKEFLASKVVMMTDYDDGILDSCIDEYIDEFMSKQSVAWSECEDAVSRQEVADILENADPDLYVDLFNKLPSVTPKQRTGKWILDRSGAYCCSECMEPCATYVMMRPRDKYCKMCGSRNEVTT